MSTLILFTEYPTIIIIYCSIVWQLKKILFHFKVVLLPKKLTEDLA